MPAELRTYITVKRNLMLCVENLIFLIKIMTLLKYTSNFVLNFHQNQKIIIHFETTKLNTILFVK